jgi:hypothetical protein
MKGKGLSCEGTSSEAGDPCGDVRSLIDGKSVDAIATASPAKAFSAAPTADQVGVLAVVLGRRLRFEAQTDGKARAEMSASMPSEHVDAFFNYFAEAAYDDPRVLPTVQQLTGRPAGTFEGWATVHREMLGARA